MNLTSSSMRLRVRCVAAGVLLVFPLLAPAAAHAQEKPPSKERVDIRLGMEVGPFALLDGDALNRALASAGYSTLPHVGAIYGGTFALEYRRFYASVGLLGTTFPSASSVLSHRIGLLDLGYRVLGRPRSWGIIPFVGLGPGTATLTTGLTAAPRPEAFAQAIHGRSLAELQATSMLVHAGILFDLLRAYDARGQRGVALDASAGFLGAPLSSAWAPSTPTATGEGVSGGPHVPGTGVYTTLRFTFSF